MEFACGSEKSTFLCLCPHVPSCPVCLLWLYTQRLTEHTADAEQSMFARWISHPAVVQLWSLLGLAYTPGSNVDVRTGISTMDSGVGLLEDALLGCPGQERGVCRGWRWSKLLSKREAQGGEEGRRWCPQQGGRTAPLLATAAHISPGRGAFPPASLSPSPSLPLESTAPLRPECATQGYSQQLCKGDMY